MIPLLMRFTVLWFACLAGRLFDGFMCDQVKKHGYALHAESLTLTFAVSCHCAIFFLIVIPTRR